MFQLSEDAAGDERVELSQLHKMALSDERAPLSLALIHGFKVAGYKCPAKWNKAFLALPPPPNPATGSLIARVSYVLKRV
jgi:hypothetical protein